MASFVTTKWRAWKYFCSRNYYSIYLSICLLVRPWLVCLCVYILSTFRKNPCAVSIRSSMLPRLDCSHSPSWIVQNSTNRSVAMTVWPVELLSRTFLMWCCLNTDSHFRVSGWNAHVWPFAWKLLTTTLFRCAVHCAVQNGSNFTTNHVQRNDS